MVKVQILNLESFCSWFTPGGLYVIAYSWLFGMCELQHSVNLTFESFCPAIWVSFFGGVIAFKALPRQQFGALQHKTFPIYFVLSIVLSSLIIVHWVFAHPDVVTYIWRPWVTDVAQLYALLVAFGSQSLNYFVIGPTTSKTMFERYKLEKEEGKNHHGPGVSDKMKAVNRKFGMLHGISSFFNLAAVIALAFHGLYIGNAGVKGY
ncbi:hypothetical protein AX15_005763 [Amanita polypyramis BW_CC]|nr:hypothetical protein AX15_005763 [Amanita polypyramis BW_CC]